MSAEIFAEMSAEIFAEMSAEIFADISTEIFAIRRDVRRDIRRDIRRDVRRDARVIAEVGGDNSAGDGGRRGRWHRCCHCEGADPAPASVIIIIITI